MDKRNEVAKIAMQWLGTPYHHNAMVKGVGVDCAMLVKAVYSEVYGEEMTPAVPPYPHDWHLHRHDELYWNAVSSACLVTENPDVGDIGLWKFGRTFSHGAIFLDDRRIIHAVKGQGVVLGAIDEDPLRGRENIFFSVVE